MKEGKDEQAQKFLEAFYKEFEPKGVMNAPTTPPRGPDRAGIERQSRNGGGGFWPRGEARFLQL